MEKGRTRYVFNNITLNFLNRIITIILGFVSRTIFIKVLGTELLGVNGLFSDVLNWLSMADLGFSTAMSYSFYKPLAENDTKKISALVTFYKKVYMTIALAITIIGISITPFLNIIVKTDKQIPLLRLYYLFALGGVIISYLFVYKTSIITADQKNYIVIRINMIVNIIKIVLQMISLIIFKNYIAYLTINIIGNFLCNYIASRKAASLYPFINEKNTLNKEERQSIFINMKSIFLYKVSSLLLTATDNTLISLLLGINMVGLYSNYFMLSSNIILIIQIVFSSLTASIGNLIVKEKDNKRYEVFKASQSISFIICGIIVICYLMLANDFINIWLGENFIISKIAVIAISVNMYLTCVLQPLWSYREATGLYVKTKYVMLVTAMVNLVLSVVLGKAIGLAGILFASAIARLSTYFWYEPLLLFKNYFSKPVKNFYVSILINVISIISIYTILNGVLSRYKVTSWQTLIAKALMCWIIVTIFYLLIYSKSQGVYIALNKIKVLSKIKVLNKTKVVNKIKALKLSNYVTLKSHIMGKGSVKK